MKTEYATGCYWNDPHERAPEFVIGRISINVDKFLPWLEGQETSDKGYVSLNVKRGRDGKPYVELDTYKKSPNAPQSRERAQTALPADDFNDSIPF